MEQQTEKTFLAKHSLPVFIAGAIVIALFMTFVSMEFYSNSGAAQLDLSRPGYKSVRSQAVKGDGGYETFSANGSLDISIIDNFIKTYKKQSDIVRSADAFAGDPLNPALLVTESINSESNPATN